MLGTRSERLQDPWKWFGVRGSGPRLSFAIILLCLGQALIWTDASAGACVASAAAPEEAAAAQSFQQFASASAENFKSGDLREKAGAGQTRAGITSLAKEGRRSAALSDAGVTSVGGASASKAKADGQATSGEQSNPKRAPDDTAWPWPRDQPQAPRNAGSNKSSRKGGGGDYSSGQLRASSASGGVWTAVAAAVASAWAQPRSRQSALVLMGAVLLCSAGGAEATDPLAAAAAGGQPSAAVAAATALASALVWPAVLAVPLLLSPTSSYTRLFPARLYEDARPTAAVASLSLRPALGLGLGLAAAAVGQAAVATCKPRTQAASPSELDPEGCF